MKKIFLIMLLGSVLFTSCNDAWNDHYDDTAGGTSTGGVEEEVLDISLQIGRAHV